MFRNFIIHQIFSESCSLYGISEYNGSERSFNNTSLRSFCGSFLFFLEFYWLDNIGSPRCLINLNWHKCRRDVTLTSILSFSSLNFTYCRWRRRAGRRCWVMTLLSWKCPRSWWVRSRRRTWTSLESQKKTKSSVLQGIRIPFFNEMWFFDHSSIRRNIPFSSQSFPRRQYCWRVFEDFHSQEYIQFFDIHCCLFMRLHFSIGGYDYRRTARFRQSIHSSITQVLFADHMHWRTGVDNKLSFLRFKSWCRQTPIFPKVRRMLLFLAPLS